MDYCTAANCFLNNFEDLKIDPYSLMFLSISFLLQLILLKRKENAFMGFKRGPKTFQMQNSGRGKDFISFLSFFPAV